MTVMKLDEYNRMTEQVDSAGKKELGDLYKKYQEDIRRVKNETNESMIENDNQVLDSISVEKKGNIRTVRVSNFELAAKVMGDLSKRMEERKKLNS